jgi:hypothetical protein
MRRLLSDDDAAVRWWATGIRCRLRKGEKELRSALKRDRSGAVRVAAVSSLSLSEWKAQWNRWSSCSIPIFAFVTRRRWHSMNWVERAKPAEAAESARKDPNEYVVRVVEHALASLATGR